MTRVCHFSSVHPADDVRIFHKQCRSLAEAGHEVFFVVPAEADAERQGVHIRAVAAVGGGRLLRMLLTAFRTFMAARAVRARIYHFHDPELLPWALLLKWSGARVIYDAHEDVPRDIITKAWIPGWLRRPLAWCFEHAENFMARRLDCVVTATPHIRDRFLAVGCRALDINNYPIPGELRLGDEMGDFSAVARPDVCYAGVIIPGRGSAEMVQAVGRAGVTLQLLGRLSPGERERLQALPGWRHVQASGLLPREQVAQAYARSFAGLVLFHDEPNHRHAQPNKLFEYMSAGIPLIASHFPLWREVVEQTGAGICVDPLDVGAIAAAIRRLNEDRALAAEMGACGREAVRETYNWRREQTRLLALYDQLEA